MVAIQPLSAPDEQLPARPHLRLIQGGRSGEHAPNGSSLYRRRRVAALVLSVALVVGAAVGVVAGLRVLAGGPGSGSLTAPAAASSAEPAAIVPVPVPVPVPVAATAHVVRPGDTLWGIARDITPVGGDVSATVDHLVARNGGVVSLQPGMRLLLD